MRTFSWMNESELEQLADRLVIQAPARSDFFNYGLNTDARGLPDETVANAPFYHTVVRGDFVLRVKVTPHFQSQYDACAVMVMQDDLTWGKLCFEQTDFGTRAVVSVVTRGRSDDANGVNVTADALWLQVARVGNYFAFHYSLDGERYLMNRLFHLECGEALKVGLVAQSPVGEGGPRLFEHPQLEERSLSRLREGV